MEQHEQRELVELHEQHGEDEQLVLGLGERDEQRGGQHGALAQGWACHTHQDGAWEGMG